jgi:hypothetical protein
MPASIVREVTCRKSRRHPTEVPVAREYGCPTSRRDVGESQHTHLTRSERPKEANPSTRAQGAIARTASPPDSQSPVPAGGCAHRSAAASAHPSSVPPNLLFPGDAPVRKSCRVVIHRCPAKHSLHTLHVDNGSGEATTPAFLGQPKPNHRRHERASPKLSFDCHLIVEPRQGRLPTTLCEAKKACSSQRRAGAHVPVSNLEISKVATILK